MAYAGNIAVLKMGTTSIESEASTLTTRGLGCSAISFNDTHPSREVPGYHKDVSRESEERSDHEGSFEVDVNSTTAPLFAGTSGKRRYFWLYPEGTASGEKKYAYEAYIGVTVQMPANSACRFEVSTFGDSEVTTTTV